MGLGCLGSELDIAAEAHGPDVFGVNALHAIETVRAAAGLAVPCRPVPLDHRSIYADGPDIVGVRAPYAKEVSPGAAGLGGPCRPVPLIDRSTSAHGPDVVGVRAPHASEVTNSAAGLSVPCRPVPLEDAFSRYIVHHRLLTELSRTAVSVELEAVLASCTGAKPRIVHDHGSEFCNAELRAVMKAHDLIDIRTRARHPESNGIVERWNGTVRHEGEDCYGDNYLAAQRKVQQLVYEYNNVRLHAALGYFEPRELHFGNPSQRREDRAHKLRSARHQRSVYNRSQMATKRAQPL